MEVARFYLYGDDGGGSGFFFGGGGFWKLTHQCQKGTLVPLYNV